MVVFVKVKGGGVDEVFNVFYDQQVYVIEIEVFYSLLDYLCFQMVDVICNDLQGIFFYGMQLVGVMFGF